MNFQIHGRKSWTLRSPPECYWSCPKGDLSIVMEPGKHLSNGTMENAENAKNTIENCHTTSNPVRVCSRGVLLVTSLKQRIHCVAVERLLD